MNPLETEYSFLAPTWKLPPIGSPAMYPGTYGITYSPTPSKLTPNAVGITRILLFFFFFVVTYKE